MPDYQIRLTVHADDELDASAVLEEIKFPSNTELISTSLLGDNTDTEEDITKTTFLYNVLHDSNDEVETISDALDLVANETAIGEGMLIASTGIPRERLESELMELGDEGDFFSSR